MRLQQEKEAELLKKRFRDFILYLNRRGVSNREISLNIGRAPRYIDNCFQKRTDVGSMTIHQLHKVYDLNFIWYFTGCGPRRVTDGVKRRLEKAKASR